MGAAGKTAATMAQPVSLVSSRSFCGWAGHKFVDPHRSVDGAQGCTRLIHLGSPRRIFCCLAASHFGREAFGRECEPQGLFESHSEKLAAVDALYDVPSFRVQRIGIPIFHCKVIQRRLRWQFAKLALDAAFRSLDDLLLHCACHPLFWSELGGHPGISTAPWLKAEVS